MVADVTAAQNILPKLQRLVFVWSIRSPDSFEYAAEELRRAAASIAAGPAGDMPTIEVWACTCLRAQYRRERRFDTL
jgi:hypothetical protein